jgi:hypothetical protein
LHSLGGADFATNYLFYSHNPPDSTGTGSVTSVGATYENSMSSLQGKELGSVLPDVSFSLFGLVTMAKADLPATTNFTQSKLTQFKYGVDVTLQATSWFGFMARYDLVNLDKDNGGYILSAVTPRMIFSSHFLSGERIYIQYTRYTYGDKMTLAGSRPLPWGQPTLAGATVLQQSPYIGRMPDRNVVKLQAEIAF